MVLHLRDSTSLPRTAGVLRQQANEGRGVAAAPSMAAVRVQVHSYLNWVDSTEAQLRNFFLAADVLTHLRSAAHWEIVRGPPDHFVERLISREVTEQAVWLDRLADRLDQLWKRLTDAPGTIAVVDTNVLMHYQRPSEVNWLEVVPEGQVRLVLPLRVIEELDEKKWLARDDLKARAQAVLSGLWRLLETTRGGPAPLRAGVTVEVPIDDEPRHRTLDADQEILDTCEQVRNVSQPVWLVTGDTAMSIRAVERGLRVARMPEKYRRKRPERGSAEAEEEAAGL